MTHALGPCFDLDERHADGRVWLKLTGELDVATAPRLADRLHQLREENRTVVVDLPGVEFMDSSGLHALFDAVADARRGSWTLEVRDDVSPQVRRLLQLVGLERFILATPAAGPGRDLPLGAAHTLTADTKALTMTRASRLS